ncbi:hypothetical protein TspCOW1_20290 [Thiohalobacter sp. COW1]|uniref:hypothetical protein n=1 Tax=Thiohalobacter sp. COW1 TaxID=2795687 RepID=UPI001914F7F8|nr:hypothetical protein [Thiohalobacter sp. COW1]BCO31926.1 hypothetical protein TspCOW1_20290 [Thiohalobacter sp. COW1]
MKTGFYEARLAPIISDLTQVVVSLGLISVSLGYVNAVITDNSLLYSGAFWLRLVLLLSTVSFTCYSLLGYVADMEAGTDTGWAASCRSPSRIIILFLIDLTMLGEQGWMYGVLLVADISDLGEAETLQPFSFQTVHFVLLALLAAAWHGTTFIWHLVAGSRIQGQLSHLLFLLAFGTLALLAAWWQPADLFSQWLWALIYTAVVLLLFFTRGRKLVGQVLTRYRQGEAESA